MLGTWLLSSCEDGIARLTRMWEMLLPAIVAPDSLAYFQQFLAREALRHQAEPGPGAATRTRPPSTESLALVRPQLLGEVLEGGERNPVVGTFERRLAHQGPHG